MISSMNNNTDSEWDRHLKSICKIKGTGLAPTFFKFSKDMIVGKAKHLHN